MTERDVDEIIGGLADDLWKKLLKGAKTLEQQAAALILNDVRSSGRNIVSSKFGNELTFVGDASWSGTVDGQGKRERLVSADIKEIKADPIDGHNWILTLTSTIPNGGGASSFFWFVDITVGNGGSLQTFRVSAFPGFSLELPCAVMTADLVWGGDAGTVPATTEHRFVAQLHRGNMGGLCKVPLLFPTQGNAGFIPMPTYAREVSFGSIAVDPLYAGGVTLNFSGALTLTGPEMLVLRNAQQTARIPPGADQFSIAGMVGNTQALSMLIYLN